MSPAIFLWWIERSSASVPTHTFQLYKDLGNEENDWHWNEDLQGKRINFMPVFLSTWHWFILLLSGFISFPHTDFIPWQLVWRQLKTLLSPGKLWVKAPCTPREAGTWTPDVLFVFLQCPIISTWTSQSNTKATSSKESSVWFSAWTTAVFKLTLHAPKTKTQTEADRLVRK